MAVAFYKQDGPGKYSVFIIGQLTSNSAECSNAFMFHLSFFQIYFHSYLAYLISNISQGISCI